LVRKAHDELGHKGAFVTHSHLAARFWWPNLFADIKFFVRSCHECQIRSMKQHHIPPTVPLPASLFRQHCIDCMQMPTSHGFKYIVHARCSLSSYPEFRMLRAENERTIGAFIFENILCRWGAVEELITDNG
ncbi:hypothetical protein FA15DRAFT_549116, partial [Coprinopsis marcescibilis]